MIDGIKTVWWEGGKVCLLDQRLLPGEEKILYLQNWEEVVFAIRDLAVRGAPAIGVTTALGIALGMQPEHPEKDTQARFEEICTAFAQARPTARNLFWAIDRMRECFRQNQNLSRQEIGQALLDCARGMAAQDVQNNLMIGRWGESLVPTGARILTYCNAGALATAGYGTALGVIRAAADTGKGIKVWVCETRPVLQGARLTAWELAKEKIPFTLITDNMAGWVMNRGLVDLVVTGADRIAANGDAANKIGTYSLAVLAKENGIPFYIAAPLATFDHMAASGEAISIEERPSREILFLQDIPLTPAGIEVYNPSFDITPQRLISAIITEKGLLRPPYPESIARMSK